MYCWLAGWLACETITWTAASASTLFSIWCNSHSVIFILCCVFWCRCSIFFRTQRVCCTQSDATERMHNAHMWIEIININIIPLYWFYDDILKSHTNFFPQIKHTINKAIELGIHLYNTYIRLKLHIWASSCRSLWFYMYWDSTKMQITWHDHWAKDTIISCSSLFFFISTLSLYFSSWVISKYIQIQCSPINMIIRLQITWSKCLLWAVKCTNLNLWHINLWHFHWNRQEWRKQIESVRFIFHFYQIHDFSCVCCISGFD